MINSIFFIFSSNKQKAIKIIQCDIVTKYGIYIKKTKEKSRPAEQKVSGASTPKELPVFINAVLIIKQRHNVAQKNSPVASRYQRIYC